MTYGLPNGHMTVDVTHVTPKGAVRQYTVGYHSDSLVSCIYI